MASVAYCTLAEFKSIAVMPGTDVDALEAANSGWIDGQLRFHSRWIDSRLAKRYPVPFVTPYPESVQLWLVRIVTVRAYLKRGVDPNDEQFELISEDAKMALKEIEEAANSETGLFELPTTEGSAVAGATRGSPRSYTEASPYTWADEQGTTGHEEDGNGEGTFG